jgi:hypothetical protein
MIRLPVHQVTERDHEIRIAGEARVPCDFVNLREVTCCVSHLICLVFVHLKLILAPDELNVNVFLGSSIRKGPNGVGPYRILHKPGVASQLVPHDAAGDASGLVNENGPKVKLNNLRNRRRRLCCSCRSGTKPCR